MVSMRVSEGQISTETIIIFAILLAVIVLVATNLQKIVKENAVASTDESKNISGTINAISISGLSPGDSCSYDYECDSGNCRDSYCQ